MARHRLQVTLTAMFVLAAVHGANAQCAFEHPKKAAKFQASLVQAFWGCGESWCHYECSPNRETEGGVPACGPPATFNEQLGDPPNGWRWDPNKGQGRIQLKALSVAPGGPLNPPGDTTDVAVLLKLKGVVDAYGPATGDGTLALILRTTLDDRNGGDMMTIDFPLSFPVAMTAGTVRLKTTLDAALNALPQPGLPHCSSIDVVWISVEDPNSNTFADVGIYLE